MIRECEDVMNNLSNSINHMQEIALRCKDQAPKAKYKCQICRDTGMEVIPQIDKAPIMRACQCRRKEQLKEQWINAGFNIMSANKSFDNFKTNDIVSNKMRSLALEYVNNFEGVQFSSNNSVAMLGQPGSGKTHICIAICFELIKKGFSPRYFPYREEIINLKQNVINAIEYQETINKFKKCTILFIDDLFKGGANESDIRIMFEIINYRYINRLATIISSELLSSELIEVDEALGSRIIEMCKGRTLDLFGSELNHRL